MTGFNYELIYKLRSAKDKLIEAEKAKKEAEQLELKANALFKDHVISAVGNITFYTSSIKCLAEGMDYCIFTGQPNAKAGSKNCICCGSSNIDIDDDENK